jgi:hypothetical protein
MHAPGSDWRRPYFIKGLVKAIAARKTHKQPAAPAPLVFIPHPLIRSNFIMKILLPKLRADGFSLSRVCVFSNSFIGAPVTKLLMRLFLAAEHMLTGILIRAADIFLRRKENRGHFISRQLLWTNKIINNLAFSCCDFWKGNHLDV